MPWEKPGRYEVSFEVRDMMGNKLIDPSEVHELVVKTETDSSRGDQKGKSKPSLSEKSKGGDDDREHKRKGEKISEFVQSPETAGLALACLMFPLVLTLATELHRGRPLTQSTIKPAFYAQFLYPSPFVVSIWIPILLLQYHPEPEQEYMCAFLLAAVIFLWLVIAEVGFVRLWRLITRKKVERPFHGGEW